MRAMQITELTGPAGALSLVGIPEPEPSHMLTPGRGVVVEVHAAGVSFPEVLQTRGEYQVKPPLPFVPGSEVGGLARSAPDGATVGAGDRVAGFCMLGAFAEVAVAPEFFCFKLPDAFDFAQGASLVLNYHTAYFALKLRGRLQEGRRCWCTVAPAVWAPPRSRWPGAWGRARSPSSPPMPERVVELMQKDFQLGDTSNYHHWDKLRHLKPPEDLSHEEWWFVIKCSRGPMMRSVPLTDRMGKPLSYSTPDVIQRQLHYVDQRCSGEIAMPAVVTTDEQARQHYLVNSLMEEAIRSSQLEGATTFRQVAKALLRSGRPPKGPQRANDFQQLPGASVHAGGRAQAHTGDRL